MQEFFGRAFPLGPKMSIPDPTSGRLNIATLKRMDEENKRRVFAGTIYYNDIFPGSPRHITKFCYLIRATTNSEGNPAPEWYPCRHWNCMDDECKEDKKRYEEEQRGIPQSSSRNDAPACRRTLCHGDPPSVKLGIIALIRFECLAFCAQSLWAKDEDSSMRPFELLRIPATR